jgi:hypothetical protein
MLPGSVLGRAMGLRGARLLALASPLSMAVLAPATALTHKAFLPWGLVPVTITTVVMSVASASTRLLCRRHKGLMGGEVGKHPEGSVPRTQGSSRGSDSDVSRSVVGLTASALLLGVSTWGWLLTRILPSTDSFSQTYDNVFHLSTIRFIHDTGAASPLLPVGLGDGTAGIHTYPTLWHAFAALSMPPSGDVAVATNAAMLLVCGLLWPSSLLTFLFAVARPRPATIVATGVLAAGVPSFPLLMITMGVQYPNALGFGLVPAVAAGLVTAVGLGPKDLRTRISLSLAGIALLPAVFLAHPNALALTLLVVAPALATAAWRSWAASARPRTPARRVALATTQAALGLAMAASWFLLRPGYNAWPPISGKAEALGNGVLLSLPGRPADLVTSALVVVGLLVVARSQGLRWLVMSWLVVLSLWVVAASFAVGPLRTFLTETFYSDPPRLAAALGVIGAPLGLLGLDSLIDRATVWARRTGQSQSGRASSNRAAALVIVVVTMALLVTQSMPAQRDGIDRARDSYEFAPVRCVPGDRTCLVTADERALLRRLPSLVESGAVILTVPTNGSSLAYALEGLPVAWTYISEPPRLQVLALQQRLDQVPAGDPDICAAAAVLRIGYVLDFGLQNVSGDDEDHAGLDDLASASSVERVEGVGDAVLYRLSGCSSS